MEKNRVSVVFFNFAAGDPKKLGYLVRKRLLLHLQQTLLPSPDNPIVAQNYLIAGLFVVEQLAAEDAARMIATACDGTVAQPIIVARTALSILQTRNIVSVSNSVYRLTPHGLQYFKNLVNNTSSPSDVRNSLDRYRVEFMNRDLRRVRVTSG